MPPHAFSIVTWGSAHNISGDSDVSTLGSLLYAYNAGGSGVTATTVNGVTFSPYVFPYNGSTTTTTGNVTFAESPDILLFSDNLGSISAPFSNLSSNYQSLLSSGGSAGAVNTITASLGGLTAGRDYLFQWWTNDSTNSPYLPAAPSQAQPTGPLLQRSHSTPIPATAPAAPASMSLAHSMHQAPHWISSWMESAASP